MNIKSVAAVLFAALLVTGAGCKPAETNSTPTNDASSADTNSAYDSTTDYDTTTQTYDSALTYFHDVSLPYDQSMVNGPFESDGIEYYQFILAGASMDSAESEIRSDLAYSDWTVDTDEYTDTGWHFLLYRGDEKMVIDLAYADSGDGIDIVMAYAPY